VRERRRSIDSLRKASGTLRSALALFWSSADSFAKQRLLLALAIVGVGALLAALLPVTLKTAVDSLGTLRPAAAVLFAPLAAVLLYASGQFVWRCSIEVRNMLHGHAEQRLRRHISRRLFEHLVRMPLRFHLERRVGALGDTVEQGLKGYELLLLHVIYTVVPVTIEFAALIVVLLKLEQGKYLFILCLASIAYIFAFHRWATRIYEPSETAARAHMEAHSVLTDTLINHETVKYFNAERVVCTRYDTALGRTESAWRRFFTEYAINGVIVAFIFGASLAICLTLGAYDVSRGILTVGGFVLINAYVVRIIQPLELLGVAVRDIAQGLAFLSVLFSLSNEACEAAEADDPALGADELFEGKGELTFDQVTLSYDRNRTVLQGVSFNVPAGRTVGIVGVSGSGKSSLIRLLFRLYEPDSGRILLDGTPINELPLSVVRHSIGIIPQDTVLFHDTIANNIAFGRTGASRAEVEQAARLANLEEFIRSLPDGYETIVGERGLKLSGGERQRIAIARAAIKRPKVFVCDEATSSLDSATEQAIMRNLIDLSRRRTTLIVAHRLSTVRHASEIVVLNKGVLVERGSHDELRARNGYYAGLWDAQQSRAPQTPIRASTPA
jgi:ABC-type transport system involved in Fe-S cluster assembly fused permease/ATPase subunit